MTMAGTRKAKKSRRILSGAISVVLGLIFFVPLLFPLYWVVVASFQDLSTIYANAPALIPTHIYTENYRLAFSSIIGNIGVSLVIAVSVVVLSWLVGVPAAHALARRGGRLAALVILIMLVTQMIPGISLSIALYTIFHRWGLLGSYIGLILADAAAAIPFAIIVLRAFMVTLSGSSSTLPPWTGPARSGRSRRSASPWPSRPSSLWGCSPSWGPGTTLSTPSRSTPGRPSAPHARALQVRDRVHVQRRRHFRGGHTGCYTYDDPAFCMLALDPERAAGGGFEGLMQGRAKLAMALRGGGVRS